MTPGSLLGERYRVERLLGRGAMGPVYLCEDIRLPGRRWALRELTLGAEDAEGELFEHEAAQLARLSHPNLPEVVDFFGQGRKRYIVMEFVQGDDMVTVVEARGPASPGQGLRWGRQLAQAVDYLHSEVKPLLFRQLGPENIILSTDRKLKLVDFGLANHLRGHLPPHGAAQYYEAPELRSEQEPAVGSGDQRADVYSLGATLYYLFTGTPPEPTRRSLGSARPSLPVGLARVVEQALDADPERRFQTARELDEALAAVVLDAAPSGPRRAPPIRRPSSQWWLGPALALVTVAFMIAASLGVRQRREDTIDSPAFRAALRLYRHRDYRRAEAAFRKLLAHNPDDPLALILAQNSRILIGSVPFLRLPVVTSMHGADSEGVQLLYGLALCQRDLQASGQRFVLDVYDDRSRVDRTVQLAEEITDNPDYTVMIGPFSSQQTLAVAPVFDSAGMPMVAPVASDHRVTRSGPYVFTVCDTDDRRIEILADRYIAAGFRRVAVYHDVKRAVTVQDAAVFAKLFRRMGGRVVVDGGYAGVRPDFSGDIEHLRAGHADCVFLSEYRGRVVGRFARALRGSGSDIPIATIAVATSRDLVQAGGAAAEGILLSTYFHKDLHAPAARRFIEEFKRSFGHLRLSHREANAYDSMALAAKAIRVVGNDRHKIRDYLYSIGRTRPAYDGVSGKFAPSLHLNLRQAYILEVRNGVYELNSYMR